MMDVAPAASRAGFTALMGGAEVALGIRNVFNTAPPVDVGAIFAYYSPLGDPLLANYQLSIRKAL